MVSRQKQHNERQAAKRAPGEQQAAIASALAKQAPHDAHADYSDHDGQTLRKLQALQALTDTALSHLPLEELLPELLERVRVVMQVDNVAILLLDADAQELELRAARGLEEEVVGQVRIPVGVGFAGQIAATRAPLAIADLSTFPVSNPLLRDRLRSALGAPLLAGGRVLGVVHIGTTTPHEFTPEETALLEQVADRIARAVERAQLFAAADAARRTAEERAAFLNTTLAALGDGMVILDTAGHLLYGNPAYSALLGIAAPRATGSATDGQAEANGGLPFDTTARLPLLDVHDSDGAPLAAEELAFARVLRGETLTGSSALDIQLHRLDGQVAFLSVTGAPVRDATGALLGAVLVVRDVTERRRLERQAQERSARLEAIFSAVADGLFVYDATGHIVERNPAADAMLASLASPDMRDGSLYERSRTLVGGLRDSAGRPLPEAQWPQARIAHGETLSGPTSVDIRLRQRNSSQDTYLNVSGAPLHSQDGAVVGSVCLYRDLTERWELHEALEARTRELEANTAQMRTLLDVLPVGVAIVDVEGKPLLVNDAVRHIWGQNLPLAEDTTQYGEYRAWRATTGEPVAADEWGLARALANGETTVGLEYTIEAFDGQRKAILDSATPLRDASGTLTGAVSVIFDITERRQFEQRTRDALEAFIAITSALVEAPNDAEHASSLSQTPADDAIAAGARPDDGSPLARRLAQLTRSILGCSRVAVSAVEEVDGRLLDRPAAIVGMTPEQERKWWAEQLALQPHEVGTGMLPEDRDRMLAGEVFTADLTRPPYQVPNDYGVTAVLAAAMRIQGRMVGLLTLDFERPANEPHVFTPEEIQIAEAVARLGAVALECDRLLGEREVARTEALALAEANRRMDEFLGIAGHELRTPITTVKANLQLAERRARQLLQSDLAVDQKSGIAEQLLHLLERATQSAERQERLVQDLLDISRISIGRLEYRMASCDLTMLARESVEEQRLGAPRRQIELTAPEQPVRVLADADRINQVLTNYLTNAIKYSPVGTPITLTIRQQGEFARVEAHDSGPGLSREQQRRLFERFQRVEGIEVLSGSGVGLGLGLYISKTIVEQHGGAVGVESAPGKGSTFWFTLPLLDTAEGDPDQ